MTSPVTISITPVGNLRLHIPLALRKNQGRKVILAPQCLDGAGAPMENQIQVALVQALARAHAWANILEAGEATSLSDLARLLQADCSYVARILKLVNLAPKIVGAILAGQEPSGLSLEKLTRPFPDDWTEQASHFGFPH